MVKKTAPNLFATAAAMPAKAPKASKSDTKQEIEIKGMEKLAMVDSLITLLEGVKGTYEAQVKGQMGDLFYADVKNKAAKPESFRGVEGIASASCEIRKRSTRSALTEAQCEVLRGAGLEPNKAISIPALFAVNPEVAGNMELLGKVSEALNGIVPANFFVQQKEQYTFTVTDEMLAQACRERMPREVIDLLTTLACKPKLVSTDVKKLMGFVEKLVTEKDEAQAGPDLMGQLKASLAKGEAAKKETNKTSKK